MPEGPEVRKNAESLAHRASGRQVIKIEILSGRYVKKMPSGLSSFCTVLPKKVIGVGAHGKFLYWLLDDELSIWSTLGMTGHWTAQRSEHSRIKIVLNDGDVYFNDQRNFGTIKFIRGKFQLIEKLKSLGPDMLAEDVKDDVFVKKIRKYDNWTITKALMDQKIVAGIGNYIKADSLWLARISPHRKISDMSDIELSTLNSTIKQVMRESYQSGGAPISSYRNFDGSESEYNRRFLVYNQKTDPDGNDVVRELTDDNRTTHWCPSVQI
jgi:DNA-formamidopyrimidine glycosylase|tara:strand:- start:1002 stop:1805 length:804 start_codon:yes stop_codon:yes gene_type:complete